ncbi:hypothetical protein CRUP_006416 [Coryphaenoides rupestris]|nr:hypothetical protein CRUP_006416 [Coryphaenoides rupestris]
MWVLGAPLAYQSQPGEKKWFTDEPESGYPRNIQIQPMNAHMANQVAEEEVGGGELLRTTQRYSTTTTTTTITTQEPVSSLL